LQQTFFIFLKNILGLQANYPPSTQLARPTTFVLSNIQGDFVVTVHGFTGSGLIENVNGEP